MRNLNLLRQDTIKLNLNDSFDQFYVNKVFNSVYLLTTNGTATCINIENKKSENFHLTTSPIKLTYLSVTSEISIIDSKSIFIFDQNLNLTISYNFTNGCKIAEYSPAQDLLAVLTDNLTIQVLNIDSYGTFSVINEIELNNYKYVNQFINIGWGSKETQFHGSEGKEARKNRAIDNSDSNEISINNSNITWRGDGLLFAVSFVRGKDYAFLVLNKDGVPQYSSEICPGLESPLCWKPSGNLIAGVQKLPNKYQIVFFEKNGLRHGEFTIPDKAKVKKISWSSDSEILCILYENNIIQLWTVNNYHWYLKQSIQFENNSSLTDLYWDPGFETKNGKILYLLCDSSILIYEWIWKVNHSNGLDEDDLACVAVIDGTKALITSFKKSSIPPPMSAVTLQTNKSINFVVFGPSDRPNDLCVIFDDYYCNTYKCTESFKYELVHEFSFDDRNCVPLSQHHILWVQLDTFLSYSDGKIRIWSLEDQAAVNTRVIDTSDVLINMEIVPKTNQIVVQLINGDIFTFDTKSDKLEFSFKMPSVCDLIKPCLITNKVINKMVVFGLDRFNRFYVDQNCIANTITSFYIHSEFLLLTTSQHLLICVQLNEEGLQMLRENASNMFMRQIERGSKIIVAVQRDRKVVLQMPRGNLETICPRIMSLQMINNLLDSKRYEEAFQIMKVERINLNILYDYNPKQFLEDIELFINQINDPTHLNMFLLELRDEDVTQTMYSMCYPKKTDSVDPNKKSLIADTFVKYLSTPENKKKFLLTIITALIIKRKQTDLENALNVIYEMKLQDRILAEKALEHLLLLVSINELYNIALGMYNFDLIMFVAAKSQKDPKEYIPFLNQLNRLDENYKKFTIDKYLKRYTTALKWISNCHDKFDECLEFIKTHNLYKESLDLFHGQQDKYATICEAFGTYLLGKRCFTEAGIMFERSSKLEQAIESYKLGGQWSHCIRCAVKLKYSSVQFNKLCLSLAEDLITQRQYKEAATVFIENLNDPEMAIEVLTNGRLWSDCLRLSYVHNRLDMIETHIKPGILQHAEILQSQIETNSNEFKTKTERLKVVKSQKQSDFEDPSDQVQYVEDGLYSDTASVISKTSNISKSSFRSFRSSKNKRKHERKLLSLKEGSKFEDIALIQFLHKLISNTFAMRQEIYDLCTILMVFNEDKQAKKLQKSLETLLKQIKESEKEIWTEDLNPTNYFMFGPDVTSNVASDIVNKDAFTDKKNILEFQFRYPPQQNDIHWKFFMLD